MPAKAEAKKQTDEYDLQPDELTKEMFADKAKVTERTVEIWKKEGKIPAQKIRRRIKGEVRKTTIFKKSDVEEFLNKENAATEFPKVDNEKTKQPETAFSSPSFAFNMFEAMQNFIQPRKSILMELTGKLFIDVDTLANVSGISKTRLEAAIKEAEANHTLRHFTGERGKSVYRCDELELLIENLPPTPKQLPPKKK